MFTSFKNVNQFISMGGYAWYVWPAYSLVFMVFVFNIIHPIYKKRALVKRLQQQDEGKT